MASVVSAVTPPAHPWGSAWEQQLPLGTGRLWLPCGSATGRRGCQALPAAGILSGASSSSFLLPDRSLKFKAGLLQAQRSKNETNKGERGCGHSYAKTIPLGAAPWSKLPFWGANCTFPAELAAPRAQQPLHCPLAEGADPAVTPLHQPGTEHFPAGAQSQGSGAGSILCPQTELGSLWSCRTNPPGHPSWAPVLLLARVELIFFTAAHMGLYFL